MKKPLGRFLLCVLVTPLLSCTSDNMPQGEYMPTQTFANLPPLALNVGEKSIKTQKMRDESEVPFPFDLSEITRLYLEQKIKPAGMDGKIVASLDEAVVTDQYKASDNTAGEWLGVGGFDVYKVRLKLRLEHRGHGGELLYGTVVHAQREIKISQHASIAKREGDLFEGLEKLFTDLDKHVDSVFTEKMHLQKGL